MSSGRGPLRFKTVGLRSSLLVFLALSALLLAGCATLTDPETSQENKHDVMAPDLPGGSFVGQSFRVPNTGLNGVTVWVKREPNQDSPSPLQVKLFTGAEPSIQGDQPVYEATVSVTGDGPLYLGFTPRTEPAGQEYTLALQTGDATVQLLGSQVDVYPDGRAYAAGQPLEGDLAFQVTYWYGWPALIADLSRFPALLGPLLAAGLLLILPGWLALDLTGLTRRLGASECAALAAGTSLAFIPLLLLWTSTLGLHWSRAAVWAILGLLAVLSLWRNWRRRSRLALSWTGLALAAILLFGLGLRLAMVRDLAAPAWVDSVHHGLITRLIMAEGRFPRTYEPFLDLPPARYHAGFHASLSTFLALTGLPLTSGMLLFGQVLNALAPLAVYLLAVTLTRDRRAGLVSAGLAAAFTPMPAYYASWGRYTQLAGLVILPAVLALVRLALNGWPETPPARGQISEERVQNQFHPSVLGLAALSLGGLILVHYRAAAFAGLILAADLASQAPLRRSRLTTWVRRSAVVLWVVAVGGLLASLPWITPNLARLWAMLASPSAGTAAQAEPFADFSWRLLTTGSGYYTLGLAGAGLVWAIITGKRFAAALILWVAGMFFLANLGPLGLPGAWFVNNTSVTITLFMPVALLGGWITSQVFFEPPFPLAGRTRAVYGAALAVVGALLLVYGARALMPILNPATFLFRSNDRPAIVWVEEHVPEGETVLINPFNWGYGVCAGSDGGYWIAPLAGRKTIPPPVIYGFGTAEERSRANEICTQVQQTGADPEALWAFLQEQRIHYVFTGVKGGPISPAALAGSPRFELLFSQGGAKVFRTAPGP